MTPRDQMFINFAPLSNGFGSDFAEFPQFINMFFNRSRNPQNIPKTKRSQDRPYTKTVPGHAATRFSSIRDRLSKIFGQNLHDLLHLFTCFTYFGCRTALTHKRYLLMLRRRNRKNTRSASLTSGSTRRFHVQVAA
jgi:hypothetical protein